MGFSYPLYETKRYNRQQNFICVLLVNMYEYEFDFVHARMKNHAACGLRPPACAAACAAPCAAAFAEAYAAC